MKPGLKPSGCLTRESKRKRDTLSMIAVQRRISGFKVQMANLLPVYFTFFILENYYVLFEAFL